MYARLARDPRESLPLADLRDRVSAFGTIRDPLNNSAVHISSTHCGSAGPPNNVYDWGRVDIFAAVQGGTPTPTPTVSPPASATRTASPTATATATPRPTTLPMN